MYKIFLICAGCGAVSGIPYDILYIVRCIFCGRAATILTVKDKVVTGICDAIWFASLAALYIFCSVKFSFPDLRLYMPAAVLFGFLTYLNSFHKLTTTFITALFRKIHKHTA